MNSTALSRRCRSALVVLTLATGCTSVSYQPPVTPESPPALDVVIEAPFADVWDRLSTYVKEQNFAVTRMERDLGQVEVGFGPVEPGTYADCGEIEVHGRSMDYEGAFTGYIQKNAQADLRGDVTVRALRSDPERTRVTVAVRYVLTANVERAVEGRGGEYSLLFNSTTPATVRERVPLSTKTIQRTCRSNYVLERQVLDTLRSL